MLFFLPGTLRVLGRACTFDDCEELSNVSAEVHRRFFANFVKCAAQCFRDDCKGYENGNLEILSRVERLYAANGMPGCVGSTDCVGILVFLLCVMQLLPFCNKFIDSTHVVSSQ